MGILVRCVAVVLLTTLAAPRAWAGDTLQAVLNEVAGLEQDARAVEPGNGRAVAQVLSRAKSLLARLEHAETLDRGAAQAARQKVLQIARAVQKLDTPGNLPREIVDPPKRDPVRRASGPPTSSDKATEQRLKEIRARYQSPVRRVDAGERLAFTVEQAAVLANETVRFAEDFRRLVSHWKSDKRTVRSMRTTNWTEGLRHQIDSDLVFNVPDTMNTQLWRSRWYLEAACEGALRRAKEKLGLVPVVVIIHGRGRPAITWESGATVDDMLQFAHHAALIGAFFEQRIGGDPARWLERQREIDAIAGSQGIELKD